MLKSEEGGILAISFGRLKRGRLVSRSVPAKPCLISENESIMKGASEELCM